MAFTLPDLAYDFGALEKAIDAKTMEIHHGKHHAGYVKKANAALEGTPWADKPVEEVIANIGDIPEDKRTAVRNNAGGHANHSLFWTVMSPNGGGQPGGELAEAIKGAFGSFDEFKQRFTEAALGRFGSGWAWLGVQGNGSLCVCSTPNQDNPLMAGLVDCPCTPILGVDVWEHAYYLRYQNKRPEYVENWWNVVDWDAVAKRFAGAKG